MHIFTIVNFTIVTCHVAHCDLQATEIFHKHSYNMFEQKFQAYFAAYKAKNLEQTICHLDENCCVWMNNQIVTNGKQEMIPSYLSDFAGTRVWNVQVTQSDFAVNDAETGVRLYFTAADNSMEMDVTYVFNNASQLMVRHMLNALKVNQ